MQTVDRRVKLRNGPRLSAERSTTVGERSTAARPAEVRHPQPVNNGRPPVNRGRPSRYTRIRRIELKHGRPPCQTVDLSEPSSLTK
ncbi:unnamed protein product [Cuscuta campestris]|uniref:Uncharacterized protein n=1 Tax=Cuscuta campestris TaxID=132261 RepID=A0A484KNH6_9ASTE|nr:unnamed protein product [Cuscuta campestris]